MRFGPFFNTRCKVRGFFGHVIAYGWVHPDSDEVLVIDLGRESSLRYGDKVWVELDSTSVATTIECVFILADKGQAVFTVPPHWERRQGVPSARVRNLCKPAAIRVGSGIELVPVRDLSLGGIGLDMPYEPTKGSVIEMELHLTHSLVDFRGKVVWYRKDPSSDRFITGCQFEPLDRVRNIRLTQFLIQITGGTMPKVLLTA